MDFLKDFFNFIGNPSIYFTLFILLWVWLMANARKWTDPKVMKWALVGSLVFLAWAFSDAHFFKEATKPDNIPIWMMTYGVAFFFWLSMRRGLINDDLAAEGKDNLEKQESDKRVYTWPDLVYSELICMVAFTAFLVVWAILVKAPLEDPANTGITPPVAKAPWYFLGLQEILVYFDPWIAGVVLPGMILVGLIVLPYIDDNPKGNGYYTIKERFRAIWVFGFGFIVLWISLIFLGTFMRGPGWNFFGPFEVWDTHKVVALSNINFSEIMWIKVIGRMAGWFGMEVGLPQNILIREFFGLAFVGFYLGALPYLLANKTAAMQKVLDRVWDIVFIPMFFVSKETKDKIRKKSNLVIFKNYYDRLGFVRYNIFMNLMLVMFATPVKMYLRWGFNLKYIVSIPEYMFNI